MGCTENITIDKFPKQDGIGTKVKVCFNYDTSKTIEGVIVRDDTEEPHVAIIKLSDDRYVLTTECQYQYQR